MGDLVALHRRHRQARILEHRHKSGHRGDHGDESEVGRPEQAGKNGQCPELQDELHTLRRQGDRTPAHGAALQIGVQVLGVEQAG